MMTSQPNLKIKVWRLHPHGARIAPASPTLDGQAPQLARRYCGPFIHANSAGFYLYSPIDLDVAYHPDRAKPWEYTFLSTYDDEEVAVAFNAMNDEQYVQATVGQQSPVPRKKVRFSAQNERPGPNVITLWTGCAFETPPGWGLWIRSPINREYAVPFRIDEGILETDWLGHDFWMNLNFYRPGETAHLRRDGPPIAHIVPVPRQAYAGWEIEEAVMNRDSDEAAAAFDRWYAFSYEKFFAKGEKDRTVYHRQRRAALKRENDEAL